MTYHSKRKTPRKKKAGWSSNINKYTVDGVEFKSSLEVYMYRALKKEKLFEGYENEKFILLDGFQAEALFYARQSNGKGEFKQRNTSKVRSMSYTPDFCGKDYIIETKGYATPVFNDRFKRFRQLQQNDNDTRTIFVPRTQTECETVIRLIKESRLKLF